jgi:hypothetical protein
MYPFISLLFHFNEPLLNQGSIFMNLEQITLQRKVRKGTNVCKHKQKHID